MSNPNKAETNYKLIEKEGHLVAQVSYDGEVALSVPTDSVTEGRNLSITELRMFQTLLEGGIATKAPAFELKPVCTCDRDECITCRCFVTIREQVLPDGTKDTDLLICPQAGIKVSESVKLSYLATLSPEGRAKYDAWQAARQAAGQERAAQKEGSN